VVIHIFHTGNFQLEQVRLAEPARVTAQQEHARLDAIMSAGVTIHDLKEVVLFQIEKTGIRHKPKQSEQSNHLLSTSFVFDVVPLGTIIV